MVSTPLSSKIKSHTRSISLPNRSHPLIPQFNEHLQRVKPCDATTTSSFPSIAEKLKNLNDLYNCVDDLLRLPQTQQVFAKEYQEKWVNETLNGYLRLVDACATAKDFIFQSKQDVQDLLSSLRRRHVDDDLHGFLTSRKRVKKMINKCISSFKNKHTVLGLEKDQETIATISMLKEADSATSQIIEFLLSSICGTKVYPRTSGWSLVSKMIHPRKHFCNNAPEFEELDATVCKLVGLGTSNDLQIEGLQNRLKEMELNIQVVENLLELLFKRLIRTRVSLLNMQSQSRFCCENEITN